MTVKTVKAFHDNKKGVIRNLGDTFTVSYERFMEINSTQFGILVEVAEAAKPKKKSKK